MDTVQRIDKIIEDKIKLPVDIQKQISLLTSDLYSGPLYFDRDGNECSCFDFESGARQYDFCQAAKNVMNYLRKEVSDTVYIDMNVEELLEREPEGWEDEETGEWIEPFWEEIYLVDDVYKSLLGGELYGTIARY